MSDLFPDDYVYDGNPDQFMYLNANPYKAKFEKEIKDTNESVSKILSNVNMNPSHEQKWGELRKFLNSDLPATAYPTQEKSVKKASLVDTMVGNSNAVGKGLNDIAVAVKDSHKSMKAVADSVGGLGANMSSALFFIGKLLDAGNSIKRAGSAVDNFHKDIQSRKNMMEMDVLDFQMEEQFTGLYDSKGEPIKKKPREVKFQKEVQEQQYRQYLNEGDGTKDTEGNIIIPKSAKAKKDAEQALDETRMNQFDHGKHLDTLSKDSDSMMDESSNLLEKVINHYKTIDVEQLDSMVQNDKEFSHA